MLKIRFTHRFKKEYKVISKDKQIRQEIKMVVLMLAMQQPLPSKFKDHPLKGKWLGYRDCHIRPDLVLIYRIVNNQLTLELVRLGSHANTLEK